MNAELLELQWQFKFAQQANSCDHPLERNVVELVHRLMEICFIYFNLFYTNSGKEYITLVILYLIFSSPSLEFSFSQILRVSMKTFLPDNSILIDIRRKNYCFLKTLSYFCVRLGKRTNLDSLKV